MNKKLTVLVILAMFMQVGAVGAVSIDEVNKEVEGENPITVTEKEAKTLQEIGVKIPGFDSRSNSLDSKKVNSISSCTTINSGGTYELTSDISASGTCIEIKADSVTFDGKDHKISGPGSGTGISVSASSSLSDVTVKNVNTTSFGTGIKFENVDSGSITGTEVYDTGRGIYLDGSSDIDIKSNTVKDTSRPGINLRFSGGSFVENNTVTNNADEGIRVYGSSNSVLKNNVIKGNTKNGTIIRSGSNVVINGSSTVIEKNGKNGISVTPFSSGTSVEPEVSGITVKGNSGSAIEVNKDASLVATDLNIGSSTKSNTEININGMKNAALSSTSNPPSKPSNKKKVGRYFDATSTGSNSYLDIELQYTNSDVSDISESSISLWKHDGSSWSELSSTVSESNNYVTTNVTSFSTFGAFGDDAPIQQISSCGVEINSSNAPRDGGIELTSDITDSSENICILINTSNIVLEGNNHVIDGQSNVDSRGVAVFNQNKRISNVTVQNLKVKEWEIGAIFFKTDDNVIKGIEANNNDKGILLGNSTNTEIRQSKANSNSKNGTRVYGTDGTKIIDSTMNDNGRRGIWIKESDNVEIRKSRVKRNSRSGIRSLDSSKNLEVIDNKIQENNYEGIRSTGSDGIKIHDNLITDNNNGGNSLAGVIVRKSDNVEFTKNKVHRNEKQGLYVEKVTGLEISNNRITENCGGNLGMGVFNVKDAIIDSNNVSNNTGTGAQIGISQGFNARNVTVRDTVFNDNGADGLRLSYPGIELVNISSKRNVQHGVNLFLDAEIRDSKIVNNDEYGLTSSEFVSVEVRNTRITDNDNDGVSMVGNVDIRDSKIANNKGKSLRVFSDSNPSKLTNVDIGSVNIVSAEFRNISVNEEQNPPSTPSDKKGIGKYLNVSSIGGGGGGFETPRPTDTSNKLSSHPTYLDIQIGYTDNDISGVVESSLSIWKHDGSSWSELSSTVSESNNYVSKNVTSFSILGVLGNESSANIAYSNLQVSDTEVNTSEDVTVSAKIENTGSASGSYNATFKVNGDVKDYKKGTLNAGKSTTVSFTTSFASEGNYDVTIDGLSPKTVKVNDSSTGSPNIVYSNLQVSKTDVNTSESVTVSATIENTGSASGSYNATFKINGDVKDYKKGTLSSGSSTTVSFTTSFSSDGTYDVTIDGLSPVKVNVGDSDIEYSNLSVSKTQVNKSEEIEVTADIENNGTDSGEYNATLQVNGTIRDYENGTLSAGSSTTVSFNTSFSKNGKYEVTVAGLPSKTVRVGKQTKTIAEVIANLDTKNDIVNFSELQQAITFWIQDKEVPGTGGKKIDFSKLQDLISLWVQETEV